MGELPNLSTSFRARYDVINFGELTEPDNSPPQEWLLASQALLPRDELTVHDISNVAKLDETGAVIRKWNYELPPMAILGMLQQVWHIQGAALKSRFPFKLKALGRIDATQIMNQRGTMVSDQYVIVP